MSVNFISSQSIHNFDKKLNDAVPYDVTLSTCLIAPYKLCRTYWANLNSPSFLQGYSEFLRLPMRVAGLALMTLPLLVSSVFGCVGLAFHQETPIQEKDKAPIQKKSMRVGLFHSGDLKGTKLLKNIDKVIKDRFPQFEFSDTPPSGDEKFEVLLYCGLLATVRTKTDMNSKDFQKCKEYGKEICLLPLRLSENGKPKPADSFDRLLKFEFLYNLDDSLHSYTEAMDQLAEHLKKTYS